MSRHIGLSGANRVVIKKSFINSVGLYFVAFLMMAVHLADLFHVHVFSTVDVYQITVTKSYLALAAFLLAMLLRKSEPFVVFVLALLAAYVVIASINSIHVGAVHIFHRLVLFDIFLAVIAMTLYLYRNTVNQKTVNDLFFWLVIFYLLYVFINHNFTEPPIIWLRPHGIWIAFLSLTMLGFSLRTRDVYLVVSTTFAMSPHYESRIAIILAVLLLLFYSRRWIFLRLVFLILSMGYLVYIGHFSRFLSLGVYDIGRSEIYSCFFENLDKVSILGGSVTALSECQGYGYLHSSYLEFIHRFGLFPFCFALFLLLCDLYKSLRNYQLSIVLSYILILCFSSVEGGFEWVFLFIFFKFFVLPIGPAKEPLKNSNDYRT